MAKNWKFLSKEQHGYGENVFGSVDEFFDFSKKKYTEKASDSTMKINNQSGISLGGILINKVGGASVNFGIRVRLDKGLGRIEEIVKRIEEYKYRLGEQGVREFLKKYIEPDIRANIYTIFKTGGINAYGDGIDWPDNSRLWKKFKEKHFGEKNVLNPFFGINSNIQFFPEVRYTNTGMLTGALRYALSTSTPEEEHGIKFHITGNNLYVGSSLPYLSNFQKDRPVLFIGENQKKAWLEMFQDYASLDERTGKPYYSIMAAKGKIDMFDPVTKFADIGKNFRQKPEMKKVKEVKEVKDLSAKNKQARKGFTKYLKTKGKM